MTPRTCFLALCLCTPAGALGLDDDLDRSIPAVGPEHGKAATADASPVDRGAFEVEFAYTPAWSDAGSDRGFDTAAAGYTHGFTGTLTYGVLPDVDVKLSTGFGAIHASTGPIADGAPPAHGAGASDLAVGARWRFLNVAAHALEVAATLDAVLPSGSQTTADELGLSQGFWSARAALVATKDLGAITANGEIAWSAPVSGDAAGLRAIAQVNGALGWQLTTWLQPELELNYQASLGLDTQGLAVTAGVVMPFGASHRLMAAVQRGLWVQNAPEATAAAFSFKTAL